MARQRNRLVEEEIDAQWLALDGLYEEAHHTRTHAQARLDRRYNWIHTTRPEKQGHRQGYREASQTQWTLNTNTSLPICLT